MNERSAVTSDGRSSTPVSSREHRRVEVAHVAPLDEHEAGRTDELARELPVTDVDREHGACPALEQHLAEAAGRGAGVERDAPGGTHVEAVECGDELVRGPTHIVIGCRDREFGVVADLLRRLDDRAAVDGHLAGGDERRRVRARARESTGGQCRVEALFCHRSASGVRVGLLELDAKAIGEGLVAGRSLVERLLLDVENRLCGGIGCLGRAVARARGRARPTVACPRQRSRSPRQCSPDNATPCPRRVAHAHALRTHPGSATGALTRTGAPERRARGSPLPTPRSPCTPHATGRVRRHPRR